MGWQDHPYEPGQYRVHDCPDSGPLDPGAQEYLVDLVEDWRGYGGAQDHGFSTGGEAYQGRDAVVTLYRAGLVGLDLIYRRRASVYLVPGALQDPRVLEALWTVGDG